MTETRVNRVGEVPIGLDIKRASPADLSDVWEIIDDCAKWLSQQGLDHWAKYYSEEMVSKTIQKKEVYLALANGKPVGTVTIGDTAPRYYEDPGYGDRFTPTNDSVRYITALAVLPEEQNQGIAGKMVNYIEEIAKRDGAKWLRLDCRIEVPGLVEFYEKRGFKTLGKEPVDEGVDGTYWFMEKRI